MRKIIVIALIAISFVGCAHAPVNDNRSPSSDSSESSNDEPGIGTKILHSVGTFLRGMGQGMQQSSRQKMQCYSTDIGGGTIRTTCY